jgi:hypothetical protein
MGGEGAAPLCRRDGRLAQSCPRLTIFEDAIDRGLIESCIVPGGGILVGVTAAGTAVLREHGRLQHAAVR